MMRRNPVVWVVVPWFLSSCATTGSTLGSGVGDRFIEHPPFYAGAEAERGSANEPSGASPAAIGYLPVTYQQGASQPSIFDPRLSDSLRALLDDMTRFLEQSGIGPALAQGGTVSAVTHEATRHPPDVRFGCETESGRPDDDCAEREGALGRGPQPMHLAVGRPSESWIAWVDEASQTAGADRVLVVTLEVGQYWIRQRGLKGTKEVELGTDHVVSFPWLTSLEGPVGVVQLTGALVGRDGKAIRIGAEGLMARRTPFAVSALGAQALVTDDEIAALHGLRRDDLPGQPLVWEEALRSLVEGLTGRPIRTTAAATRR